MAGMRTTDCPKCGRRTEAEAASCTHCGASLPIDPENGPSPVPRTDTGEARETDWVASILADVKKELEQDGAKDFPDAPPEGFDLASAVTAGGHPEDFPDETLGRQQQEEDEEADEGLPEVLADRIWWYKKVAEEDPTDISAYLMVAQAYEEARVSHKALKYYREVLKLDSNHQQAKAKVTAFGKRAEGAQTTARPETARPRPHPARHAPAAPSPSSDVGEARVEVTQRSYQKTEVLPTPEGIPGGRLTSGDHPAESDLGSRAAHGLDEGTTQISAVVRETPDSETEIMGAGLPWTSAPSTDFVPPTHLDSERSEKIEHGEGDEEPAVGEAAPGSQPSFPEPRRSAPSALAVLVVVALIVAAGAFLLARSKGERERSERPPVEAVAPANPQEIGATSQRQAVASPGVTAPAPTPDAATQPFHWTSTNKYPVGISWSPDGRKVAMEFSGTALGMMEPEENERWETIVVVSGAFVPAEEASLARTRVGPEEAPLVWDAQGKTLTFESLDEKGPVVLRLVLEGKKVERVTAGSQPDLSPDGKLLAFVGATADATPPGAGASLTRAGEVFVLDLESGKRIQITKGGGRAPLWSPDGARILYAVDVFEDGKTAGKSKDGKQASKAARRWIARDLAVARADGAEGPLVIVHGGVNEGARWIGAGDRVSYVHYGLPVAESPDAMPPALPLADRIERGELWVVSAKGKDPRRILGFEQGAVDVRRVSWKPSGKEIVYQGATADRSLIVRALTPGAAKQVSLVDNVDLFLLDPESGREGRRLEDQRRSKMFPVISPDGSRLAFLTTNEELLDQVWISPLP